MQALKQVDCFSHHHHYHHPHPSAHLPHQLPEIELPAALAHLGGAGVPQVRVVRPQDDLGVGAAQLRRGGPGGQRALRQVLHQGLHRLEEVLISQVPLSAMGGARIEE